MLAAMAVDARYEKWLHCFRSLRQATCLTQTSALAR
jgi:hypothetical protein